MLWPAGRVGSGWTALAPRRQRSAYTGRRRPLALRVRRRSPSLNQVTRLGTGRPVPSRATRMTQKAVGTGRPELADRPDPGRDSDVSERQRHDGSGDRIPNQMFLADRPSTWRQTPTPSMRRRHSDSCGAGTVPRRPTATRRRRGAGARRMASIKPCTVREFLLSETPGSCSYSYAAVTTLVHTTKLK